MLEKLFLVDFDPLTNATVLREQSEDCALVMDAPDAVAAMRRLDFDDVRACDRPFDVSKFLNLEQQGSCLQQDAHPIQPDFAQRQPAERRSAAPDCHSAVER